MKFRLAVLVLLWLLLFVRCKSNRIRSQGLSGSTNNNIFNIFARVGIINMLAKVASVRFQYKIIFICVLLLLIYIVEYIIIIYYWLIKSYNYHFNLALT